jgi:hypothetical protein
MAEAARRHKRVTQLGNHIHNDLPNYRRVVELVRSGRLGRIDLVYCWKRSASKGIGNPPDGDAPRVRLALDMGRYRDVRGLVHDELGSRRPRSQWHPSDSAHRKFRRTGRRQRPPPRNRWR